MSANVATDAPVGELARKATRDALGVQLYPGTEIMTGGTSCLL